MDKNWKITEDFGLTMPDLIVLIKNEMGVCSLATNYLACMD